MLEGLLPLALLLLLLLFLSVLFLILLFIFLFLLGASRLSTRQAKIDRLPALACCKCSLNTTSVNRQGPPSMPRAELGIHRLNR